MATSTCLDYCLDDPMSEYEVVSCPGFSNGGIPAFIVLECGHQITDPSNGTQVLAEIAAGRAHLVEGEGVSLSINDPSPVTRDSSSPCNTTPKLTTYDRTGDYLNDNISTTNDTFHEKLFDGRRFGGLIALRCSGESASDFVLFVDATITFRGGLIVGAKLNDGARYKGQMVWQSIASPIQYAAPSGVFGQ
jgi:hypothetical protein